MKSDIRIDKQYFFVLHVYLVFVTNYRQRVFRRRPIERLEAIMRGVRADFETN